MVQGKVYNECPIILTMGYLNSCVLDTNKKPNRRDVKMTTKKVLTRMPKEKCIDFLLKMFGKFNPNATTKEVAKEKARLENLEVGKLNLELEEWGFAVKGSSKSSNNDLNPNKDDRKKYRDEKAEIEAIKPFKVDGIWYSYGGYCHKDVKLNKEQAKKDKAKKKKAKEKAKATK